MAQSIISSILDVRPFRWVVACFVAAFCPFSLALAQNLPDPTRPPALLIQASNDLETVAGPVLQAILIAPNRHVAIISGQTVELNGKYGDQTLVRISETEVVLRNGKELLTLKLFPDFEKKSSLTKRSLKSNTTRQ